MIVIPAVDVKEGRCVRLREGRADAETVFSEDPVAMATQWAARGAERLHVVDLDGAFGKPRQTAVIAKIIAAVAPVPVQVGGGLRDVAAIEAVLDAGAHRVVVGTRALEPDFLDEVCRRFWRRVIVAIDSRDGKVALKGWVELSGLTPVELVLALHEQGAPPRLAALLYTDVSRDGTGRGPNVELRAEVFNLFNHDNFANPIGTLANALPSGAAGTAPGSNTVQPGQPYTTAAAGTFGRLTQTVGTTVGLGTNRQIQFALRLNF